MNKSEFIESEIEKNREAFGRWHSTKLRNSADEYKVIFSDGPKNKEESIQYGNALASTGNYPVGTSGCFTVGISGGCGPDCWVYLDGDCGEPQEMVDRLSEDETKSHFELYPIVKRV